jgi:N6-adenosine-specific RNA methylase IME4
LIERVEAGEIAVSVAAKIADLPAARQELLASADEATLRNASKQARRATRADELGEATRAASAALGSEVYGVIYADPPWRFAPYSRDTGLDRSADNHYPTMTTDDICALEVPAAEDAVLFLWATAPMLPEALAVMQAWGFAYKSHCVWAKDRAGTGYWFRNAHELLLVGTRGSVPAPAPGQQYGSVIELAVGRHSEKPAGFAEMIEEMFPNIPAIELFARQPRAGWDTWGNEAQVGVP